MVAGRLNSSALGDPFLGLKPAMRAAVAPYWRAAQPYLRNDAPSPIVVLRALDARDFTDWSAAPVGILGPGVLALPNEKGRVPAPRPGQTDAVHAFPGVIATAVWTLVSFALLSVAGSGWTRAVLGRDAHPAVGFGLMPALGAGALILLGAAVSRIGAGLGTGASWATWILVTGGGLVTSRLVSTPRARDADRNVALRS